MTERRKKAGGRKPPLTRENGKEMKLANDPNNERNPKFFQGVNRAFSAFARAGSFESQILCAKAKKPSRKLAMKVKGKVSGTVLVAIVSPVTVKLSITLVPLVPLAPDVATKRKNTDESLFKFVMELKSREKLAYESARI